MLLRRTNYLKLVTKNYQFLKNLHLLEEENRLLILKQAVQDGSNSGRAENFDPKKHLENLKMARNAITPD